MENQFSSDLLISVKHWTLHTFWLFRFGRIFHQSRIVCQTKGQIRKVILSHIQRTDCKIIEKSIATNICIMAWATKRSKTKTKTFSKQKTIYIIFSSWICHKSVSNAVWELFQSYERRMATASTTLDLRVFDFFRLLYLCVCI